jgi:hypothetical protein
MSELIALNHGINSPRRIKKTPHHGGGREPATCRPPGVTAPKWAQWAKFTNGQMVL